MKKIFRNQGGFTFVQLLITVVGIGSRGARRAKNKRPGNI